MNDNKTKQENINIDEVVYLARQDNENALKILLEYFQPMFAAMYREVSNSNVPFSYDEAMQAARIGLYNAVCYYRDDRNMAFHNFVRLCVKREIRAWQRKEKNYRYLSGYQPMASLDVRLKDTEGLYYIDTVESNDPSTDPKAVIREKELREEIFRLIPRESIDGQILNYRLIGYSYREIADKMGTTVKFVDNSLQRIKKIIAPLFD